MAVSRRVLLLGLSIGVVGGAGYLVWRDLIEPENLTARPVFAIKGLAIRGTDPVAYFTEDGPVPGDPQFSTEWKGATWHFASAGNRDAFIAEPEKYAPQYGGFCAWAVGAKGKLYSTQPENWAVVGGKLYLNFNNDVQEKWRKDIPGFIEKGDRMWPEILTRLEK